VRRDFTVTAIAYNPRDGFTDLYGGLSDIESGILRAVGEPHRRFTEDALRIMRGVRFAAELGFTVEENTERAMRACLPLLKNVSAERIYAELKKLIAGSFAYDAIERYFDIIAYIIPELKSCKMPSRDAFLRSSARERLISLFIAMAECPTDDFVRATERLKTDSLLRKHGAAVISSYMTQHISSRYDALLLLNKHGIEVARSLVEVVEIVKGDSTAEAALLSEALDCGFPYSLGMMKINGKDLLSMGINGTRVGAVLSELLDLLMRGELQNERELLLSRAREMCRNQL
jgi:tRNA nucleotidyltransferase (CCA-adding enzyme)